MTRRTPIATALIALCASPVAWSQQTADAADRPATRRGAASDTQQVSQLETITVEGARDRGPFTSSTSSQPKLPADLHDLPQSITVINKALLQTQGATSLADALRNVPGITLGGAEGGQIGTNINLNGFTARTDIYLDGFRDRGQYYRDTFALDSVEVLMGPSSMLFGRGSTGGVINQVTKKPQRKAATEFGAAVTSNGLVRATADFDRPLGETSALRIAAMAQDGRPTTRDVMKNRDVGIAPALRLGIGSPTEITLSVLLQHNRDMPDYGVSPLNGRPVAVDRKAYYGYTDDRLVQDVGALTAAIEHKLTPTATLRNQTQYNDVRINAVETASQGVGTIGSNGYTALALAPVATSALPLAQLAVRLQSHDRVVHDKSLFNQTDFSTSIDAGGSRHNLIAGAEIGHDSYVNQNFYRNGSCNGVAMNPAGGTSGYAGCEALVAPTYTASPPGVPGTPGNLATSSANTLAAYVNDSAEIGKQFKLVGGLRHDRFQATLANTLNAGNTAGSTTPAAAAQTVHHTSVRLGAIWQPSDAQSYYLSQSTSFNPSLEQLTNTTGTTAPLPPTQNRADEAGAKWDLADGKVSMNGALFRITQYNARAQGSDGTYSATGTVRVNGLRLGASGAPTSRWKVFAGWVHLDARIIDAIAVGTQGKEPGNTPRDAATLWTTCEFAPHWEIGGGAVAMASRWLNNTNLVQAAGYTRWDGTLAYRRRDWDIRLNLFNLGNTAYYDALIQSDGGRAVPGTGRSAMLSVNWRL
jgi:catecholate siderophore receptor